MSRKKKKQLTKAEGDALIMKARERLVATEKKYEIAVEALQDEFRFQQARDVTEKK